jgi:hypothetical protein
MKPKVYRFRAGRSHGMIPETAFFAIRRAPLFEGGRRVIEPNTGGRLRPVASCWTRGSVILAILSSLLIISCTVQLTAPYDSDIDTAASSLQSDFLKFAANMQMVAGTPKGYYEQQSAQYSDFEARLAVIGMRSESLSGGVACGQALEAAKKAKIPVAGQIEESVSTTLSQAGTSNASCITILVGLAEKNMERLRSQHELRCNRTAKPILCTTLFSAPPIFNILVVGPSDAPLVSAVAITLNELVGAERDLKPVGKG